MSDKLIKNLPTQSPKPSQSSNKGANSQNIAPMPTPQPISRENPKTISKGLNNPNKK